MGDPAHRVVAVRNENTALYDEIKGNSKDVAFSATLTKGVRVPPWAELASSNLQVAEPGG
jgi:hypothetical protein